MRHWLKPKEIEYFRSQVVSYNEIDHRNSDWKCDLNDLFLNYGFKNLGNGKYGSVYGNSKYQYVLKIFMKDSAYLKWISFSLKNQDNPYVPKIRGKVVKITPLFYAIRLEKLTPTVELTKSFDREYSKWSCDNSYQTEDINLNKILKYFENHRKLLDIHSGNVMMRNDQPVITDPFYNWFDKKTKTYTMDPNNIDDCVF